MILILLPLFSFFHLSFCNEGSSIGTSAPTTTTPRPPYAINTTIGDMKGRNLTFDEGNVTEYLGIPFAYPPYGPGRFLPPKLLNEKQWNGTYEFSTVANSCMQLLINDTFEGYNYTNPRKNISEDCLQLNMWVPEHKNENRTTVVFLFGDSFLYGSPSLDLNNGSMLALRSGAIIVNLNYRLSMFGFAYFGEDSWVKGNMGLLDQQVGLKWVHDNIENFGGNKSEITLYGSSAGATSVTAHLFSNNSNGLFNRAVVASGAITNIWQTNSRIMAIRFTLEVAKLLNCTEEIKLGEVENGEEESERKINSTKIIECLQNKTANEILTVVYGVYNETIHGTYNQTNGTYSIAAPEIYPFVPIDNDTVFFNGSLWDKYNRSEVNKNVDIIFGRTQDELTYLMPFMLQHMNCTFNSTLQRETISSGKKDDNGNRCLLNDTNFEGVAETIANVMLYPNNDTADFKGKLMKIYNQTKRGIPLKSRAKVARMMSDFFIHCRLSEFAEYYYNATRNSTKKNVFFYEYRKRSVINPWPKWMGAMHTWELEPIFGFPFRHPELYNKTEEENEIRRKRQTKEVVQTTTMKPNVTFEQLFSNISMKQVRNFSNYGKPGRFWLQFNETHKLGLVISGNFSTPVKYVNATTRRCKNLAALIGNLSNKLPMEELEEEEEDEEEE
uniref:Carboxylic ester hydrolase n=1 Tax=Strongyloides papillosus TaxID=174720 RepID=A0A0N5CHH2_STREA